MEIVLKKSVNSRTSERSLSNDEYKRTSESLVEWSKISQPCCSVPLSSRTLLPVVIQAIWWSYSRLNKYLTSPSRSISDKSNQATFSNFFPFFITPLTYCNRVNFKLDQVNCWILFLLSWKFHSTLAACIFYLGNVWYASWFNQHTLCFMMNPNFMIRTLKWRVRCSLFDT